MKYLNTKNIILLAITSIIGDILITHITAKTSPETPPPSAQMQSKITSPHFISSNNAGDYYDIRAVSGEKTLDIVDLQQTSTRVNLADGSTMIVDAGRAYVNANNKLLTFPEQVVISVNAPTVGQVSIGGSNVTIDLEKHSIRSHASVTAEGTGLRIEAKGFNADIKSKTVTFMGPVEVSFNAAKCS